MVEAIEKKAQIDYERSVLTKFWSPLTTDVYKEALDVFFPTGAMFDGDLLVASQTHPKNTQYVTTSLGLAKFNLMLRQVKIKISSRVSFTIKLYIDYVTQIEFYVALDTKSVVLENSLDNFGTQYLQMYDFNFVENEFTCVLDLPNSLVDKQLDFSFVNLQSMSAITVDESIKRGIDLNFLGNPPVLDSADLCAFLWSAKRGIVLKTEKLFSGESLINKEFSEIDKVDIITYEVPELSQTDFNTFLLDTENGDILVFNQNKVFHCLFVLDVKKKYYTECASSIEYQLGSFYNCKINPYDFETRCKQLAAGSIFYRVRLNV